MTKDKLKKIEIGIGKRQDILENQVNSKSIFLALGSNLNSEFGSRLKNLEVAQLLIISKNIDIIDRSSYYETLSYPNKNDPKFVNCVIKINTKLSPKNLLNVILNIEEKIGRIRKKKNEPRVCDIDILDYKGKLIRSNNCSNLTIPHHFLHHRHFVLIPLAEICPDWVHPKFKVKINFLLDKLNSSDLNYIKKI